MNRINLGFLNANVPPIAIQQQAPAPQTIARPDLMTQPDNKIIKTRFVNNHDKRKKEESDDEEDVNLIIKNIIKKKPPIKKIRKKFQNIVNLLEHDSDDEEF